MIKGMYRDVLKKNGKEIEDRGWKSNEIVEDYGRFLAALMKKDFSEKVGIEYMAVGSGSNADYDTSEKADVFKERVKLFFTSKNPSQPYEPQDKNYWVWAKKIDVNNMKYLDDNDKEVQEGITDRIEIEIKLEKNEPAAETLEFKEFALLGIDKKPDGTPDTDRMFFINYVDHGTITKDASMELTRTIKLTFPVEK